MLSPLPPITQKGSEYMIPDSFFNISNIPIACLDFQGSSLTFLDSTTNSVKKANLAAKMLYSLSKEKLETIHETPPLDILPLPRKLKQSRIKAIPLELQERAKTMNIYTVEVNDSLTKTSNINPLSTRRLWPLPPADNSSF